MSKIEAIKELMDRYTQLHDEAVRKLGQQFDQVAFDKWFTSQALRDKSTKNS